MKTFLAVYLGTPASFARSNWQSLDEAKRKALEVKGINAWRQWMVDNKPSIVSDGGPLGKTKRIDPTGITDTKNSLTGYVIVKADSHEAAARLFKDHPSFTIFPGESVEIMEVLPIPGQAG